MSRPLFQGELVRLTALDPVEDSGAFAAWSHNAVYSRLEDSNPFIPRTAADTRSILAKMAEAPDQYYFAIHTLDGNRMIGFIGLENASWAHQAAEVSIGVGEPGDWGKGYGTDAMREILRYGFEELNLHSVLLTVFEYNPRAIRSYEKVGFTETGRFRGFLNRDGRRWDMIFMDILRDEWEQSL